MTASLPMIAYLDHELVDELWALLKKDGVPASQVNKAVTKVSAQAKFGLGRLVSFLAADLEATAGGGVDVERAVTLTHTAHLRLLFLLELLPAIQRARRIDAAYLDTLSVGDFVDVSNNTYEMTQLPRLGDHLLMDILTSMRDASGDDVHFEDTIDARMKMISMAKEFTTQDRAFAFQVRIQNEETALGRFHRNYESVLEEMLSVSRNDSVVGIAQASRDGRTAWGSTGTADDILAVSLFREDRLNKTVSPFAGIQRSRIFGRLIFKGAAEEYGPRMVSIQPIALLFD